MKLRTTLLLVISLVWSFTVYSADQLFVFKKLQSRDGLSYNTVLDIQQESSGIIWFATKQGLNKYDSYRIKKYYVEDACGLPSNIIQCMLVTHDDQLYAGTEMGLCVYDRKNDVFTQLACEGEMIPNTISLFETSTGTIYVGTHAGIYAIYPKEEKIIKLISVQQESVYSISEIDGKIFAGTFSGIYVLNYDGVLLEYFNSQNTSSLPTNKVSCVYKDRNNKIWVGTDNAGLFAFSRETRSFENIKLIDKDLPEGKVIRDITEDKNGKIWIAGEFGIFIYDAVSEKAINIQHSLEKSDYHLNDNATYCLFLSAENIMWIGTYFGGVNYTILDNQKSFYNIYPGNEENELRGKAVSRIYKSSDKLIWIATEDGGVCSFDRDSKKIVSYLQHKPGAGLSSNNIHSICEDKYGRMWFGHFMTGIDIYDRKSGTIRNISLKPNEKYSITGNSVYSIYRDSKQNLWIGSREGVYRYNYDTDKLEPFRANSMQNIFIYNIQEGRNGTIWFCRRHGGVASYNPESDELRFYEQKDGLSTLQVIASAEDSKGRMWFGTIDGGINIYHPDSDRFEVMNIKDGLPNNTIYGILEADDGIMWVSSNRGLSQINYDTREIKNYNENDGLPQMQFNFSSYFKDSDNTMYFGSISGITYFNANEITSYEFKPAIMFTDFKISNESIKVGKNELLKEEINSVDQITLNYFQKAFTIDFVAVNHLSAGNNRFFCYMEGFEDNWNDIGNTTSATYTNLSPGKYTFWLKAENNDGVESMNVKKLEITIRPPFYLSRLAFVFYFIMIAGIFIFYRNLTIEREKEKAALNYEKMEKQKIAELSQQRMNFYTYISHEFKTPLSIIISSIDQLFEDHDISDSLKVKFQRLKRSSKRLVFLFNQLMDFRKIETKHAKLVLQKGDIVGFIRDTCLVFSPLYEQQRVNFEFTSNMDYYEYWFDPDKIEKIIVNLISNALKNTPLHGKIICEANILKNDAQANEKSKLEIQISDTGIGISPGEIEKLFTPFYMRYENHNEKRGSGIGLTLVKSLVEYLHGTIDVRSEVNQGTTFTIKLPLDYQGISNVKLENNEDVLNRTIEIESIVEYTPSPVNTAQIPENVNEFKLLIVEDTIDLSEILTEHYRRNFRVSHAKNGLEALQIVKEEEPDIIISDIMMPEMNGIDFCRIIKQDETTSHIAVILLTAKTLHEDRIEGLKAGAEAYITKPFDLAELDLHVRNFLEIRKKLKDKVISGENIDLEKLNFQEKDKEFIGKVSEVIHQNIENESFNTELLAQQLGMSKTLVYLKLKKLLNMSGTDYIQLLRLKKSIELMADQNVNISEIAYEVGFSDPNYFSKVFKKAYKLTPTEYRKELIDRLSNKKDELDGEA